MNHTVAVNIKYGEGTQALFAFTSPKDLIVFIHGFGGDSIGTWNGFPALLTQSDTFSKQDIIFYGYKSLETQAGNHAESFKDFLKLSVAPLANKLLPKNQNLPERNYQRIILVAHSLGAVVVRHALLSAYKDGENWISKTRMVLFAPAHKGAKVQKLAKEALTGWFGLINLFASYNYPILGDLEPGSKILEDLETETNELLDKNAGDFTKAKKVIWGTKDKVVNNVRFYLDASPVQIDKGHTGVCKPDADDDFMSPIDILKEILNED